MNEKAENLGNPAAIATVGSQIVSSPTVQKVAKVGGAILITAVLASVANKYYKIKKAKNTIRKGTKAVQQAIKLRTAMKRWGGGTFPHQSSILSSFILGSNFSFPDGTDEDAIGDIAAEITDWVQVQKDYYSIFWTELLSDLQSELDSEEFSSFFAILNREEAVNDLLKETPKGHFSLGEEIFALNNGVKLYDDIGLNEVVDKYNAGEEIGDITKVAKNKKGEYLYQVRELVFVFPYYKYMWVRGKDVTNDPASNGLRGINQILS